MEMNGAEIAVRCLAEEGVEHVFGYPGGAVLYIYDAIFKQDKFQHILVRHEQAAVHAADAPKQESNLPLPAPLNTSLIPASRVFFGISVG